MSRTPEPAFDPRPLVGAAEEVRLALRRIGALPRLRPAEGPSVRPPVVATRPGDVPELTDLDLAPLPEEGADPARGAAVPLRLVLPLEPEDALEESAARSPADVSRLDASQSASTYPLDEQALAISLHATAEGSVSLFVRYLSLARFQHDWTEELQWGGCVLDLPWALCLGEGQVLDVVVQPPGESAIHLDASVRSCVAGTLALDLSIPPELYLRLASLTG